MSMIVIKNKLIPFGGYKIINLCGVLFVKGNTISPKEYNHENIHTVQMLEMFVIGFYLWYVIEYLLIRLFHNKQSEAYYDVSFEEEAHKNDKDLGYLKTRKVFQYRWFKYIRVNSAK